MFRSAQKALQRGHVDEALTKLRKRFKRLSSSSETQSLIFGFPEADELCREIGTRWTRPERDSRTSTSGSLRAATGMDVYLVSTLYETGGHTALIGDLVRAGGERDARLLSTHTHGRAGDVTESALSRTGIQRDRFEPCAEKSLLHKLEWLISRLESLAPDRVFLLHHPDDVVVASAILPHLCSDFVFIHHVDDRPSLGVHARSVTHFDLTPFRYHHCRTWVGVDSNRYLPIACPDRGARPPEGWETRAGIHTTLSAGAARKFSTAYSPSYGETVACILEETRGRHVHIGPLPEDLSNQIRLSLEAAGIDDAAFHHVEQVGSLWQAMKDWDVDLYVSSFPVPGARASVEIMGSGTPVIWHVRSEASRYEDTHMSYPGAVCWQDLLELRRSLRQANGPWLASQSRAARGRYEGLHDPRHWQSIFASGSPYPSHSPPGFEGYRAWNQAERFRDQWTRHALLREALGRPNPMEGRGWRAGIKRWVRRLISWWPRCSQD